jgi:hypothetical protein
VSLIICSVFAIVAGSSPNWIVLGLFVCLSSFGGGGNLVLDTAVFLEYLPSSRQWMLTLMACWWGESISVPYPYPRCHFPMPEAHRRADPSTPKPC